MKLACIVLAHRLPGQLASLLSALRHPQVRIYLHIDRRKPLAPFTQALSQAGERDVVLLRRHASPWSSAGKVDADIKPFVTELQCRFGRRETASDTFEGIPGHEMGIAIDDHGEPPRADRLYELAALTASFGCKEHRFCP